MMQIVLKISLQSQFVLAGTSADVGAFQLLPQEGDPVMGRPSCFNSEAALYRAVSMDAQVTYAFASRRLDHYSLLEDQTYEPRKINVYSEFAGPRC